MVLKVINFEYSIVPTYINIYFSLSLLAYNLMMLLKRLRNNSWWAANSVNNNVLSDRSVSKLPERLMNILRHKATS